MLVRALDEADQSWRVRTLEQGWGSTDVARLGELIDAAALAGFVAVDDDEPVGLLTYAHWQEDVEVVTIQSLQPGRGIGRRLMDAVRDHAVAHGARRIWLVTTNDNLRALGFYQRWGMDLRRLVRNGVDVSRLVKPSIPAVGNQGIPLRHELELELRLG